MRTSILLFFLAACAGAPRADAPAVVTETGRLEANVGKVVTLVGVQERTKIPTVLGADVDGDYALSDKRVRVTGRVEKVVDTEPLEKDGLHRAGRGPGTSYRIVDPKTGTLAKPTPE